MAQRKRHRRPSGIGILIIFAAAAVIMAVGVGVFFNISEITVSGTGDNYTEEQIIAASGIKLGRSLLFTDAARAEEKIRDACPYVGMVTVKRSFPSAIFIEIRESSVSAVVKFEGELWLIDQNCRVLGKAENEGQYMLVTGLAVKKITVGSTVEIENTDITKLDYTKVILTSLSSDEFSKQVTELDMSNIGNIMFSIGDKYTVKLGSGEKIEYKLSRIESVIGQLDSGERAVIDVSKDGETFVIPKS